MLIYQLVFGIDSGQVSCAFHDDNRASAGIGPNGEYNCFTCGAKAHNEIGFIAKYFGVGLSRAERIKNALNRLQEYRYNKQPLEQFQIDFLKGIGLTEEVSRKYFFTNHVGKLMYNHTWNGIDVGYTWFNHPSLPTYNASADKYKYDKNNTAGILTPYDDVVRHKSLVVCEGEKDMLTAKAMGIPNAVAKVGGAKSFIIGGVNLQNKNVVICYDCDEFGREGSVQDADILTERFGCKVKIVDLGLQDKEDLNDYFIKYGKTKADFLDLIKNTSVHVPTPKAKKDKITNFIETLSDAELVQLEKILKNKKENE